MKVTYHFVTGDVEIEVADEWGQVLMEENRLLRNNDRRETRRHKSLDGMTDEMGAQFSSDVTVEDAVVSSLDANALILALSSLSDQQRDLLLRVFQHEQTISSIARAEGVRESAIRDRLARIYVKLKKSLK